MFGIIVDTEFAWGFQARVVGLSKTTPSFYYPPPTTFLGALAEAIAKDNNIGEDLGKFIISELSRNLLAIGFKPLNCIPIKYEDLNRIIMIRVVSKNKIKSPLPDNLYGSFDSPARGKTVLSSLNDDAPQVRWFLIFKNNEISVENNQLKLRIDKIFLDEKYFWKIHRLGSKESVISVINVKKFNSDEIKIIENGKVITNYAFPKTHVKDGEEIIRKWGDEVYVNPFKDIYVDEKGILSKYYGEPDSLTVFKIPIIISFQNPPSYVITLNNGKAYAVQYKNNQEVVIGR
jgi:CRISPR-associated protein Cas5a/b/c